MYRLASLSDHIISPVRRWHDAICSYLIDISKTGASPPEPHDQPALLERCLRTLAEELDEKKFIILRLGETSLDKPAFRRACLTIARALGKLLPQNANGDELVEVYDRNVGTISEGARYHQTREGGTIHTDSVNHPFAMRHLILGCYRNAELGGETILVPAGRVLDQLSRHRSVLRTLEQHYWFDGRGMGDKAGFQAPVLSFENGQPHFRYLRPYIEAAHIRRACPLTIQQQQAFDALDAILDLAGIQYRFLMEPGDIALIRDTEVFHGRTRFIDLSSRVDGDQRTMIRLWAA